ncbi:MAG TPA: transposase [Alcanivorax sp.]|jgi:putative transposase|uniref:REP-associated tyrosine transposase n=1 Tax=Alcanivorax TaxID=59753 RepID=UPI000C426ECE|nr:MULTISPECIES: transposase [Alcanivorax]MAC15124.1 transposase [Alcanivorax sp.]MBG32470.1 transposase [Alcanivorax sp.]MDF1636900.1 transposase [Alcanivorax jadensis]HBC17385.1 transposase [Alcanivorax sp.]
MVRRYQGSRLRAGRYSEAGRVYHVTSVTNGRYPFFSDNHLASQVCRTLFWSDQSGATSTLCYMLMPDHLHWLFQLEDGASLSKVMLRMKGRSGRLCGAAVWQKGYHDHAIRKEESILDVARYIVANPLRGGLVRSLRDYPYWNAAWL